MINDPNVKEEVKDNVEGTNEQQAQESTEDKATEEKGQEEAK